MKDACQQWTKSYWKLEQSKGGVLEQTEVSESEVSTERHQSFSIVYLPTAKWTYFFAGLTSSK